VRKPQYVQETQRAFGHEPDYHDAEASAACLAFVLAAQKAKSTDPDKVRNALAGLDTTSFFGTIKFDRTGQNVYKPMAVIQIQNGQSLRSSQRIGRSAVVRTSAALAMAPIR